MPVLFVSRYLCGVRLATLIGLLSLLLVVGVASPVAEAAPAVEPFRVYLSPTGSDAGSGLSPEQAVATLERAEQIIISSDPATDVEVRIAPGTYRNAAKTSWSTYLDDHKISFLPTHYDYSGATTGPRPVFQAPQDKVTGAAWFNATVPGRSTRSSEGLHFYYLEVRNYASGMGFFGSTRVDSGTKLRMPGAIRNDHNSLYGMKFQYLGDRYNWNGSALTTGSTAYKGTHAVALTNSSYNDFSNNHFLDLVGIEDPATYGADAEIIHALYVKDGSTGNVVQTSNFQRISGAPLKMRNDASGNRVTKNRLYRSGTPSDGIFYDRVERFPCSNPVPAVTTKGCDLTQDYFECPSHGNFFTENARGYLVADGEKVPAGYGGTRIPTFKRSPYSASQDGKDGCYTGPEPWLTTSGNTWLT